jgi:hypothetical protein
MTSESLNRQGANRDYRTAELSREVLARMPKELDRIRAERTGQPIHPRKITSELFMYKFTGSLAAVLAIAVATAVVVAVPLANAGGGKNRLSEIRTDIDEMYLLCEQDGVEKIVIEKDGVTVTVNCPAK